MGFYGRLTFGLPSAQYFFPGHYRLLHVYEEKHFLFPQGSFSCLLFMRGVKILTF